MKSKLEDVLLKLSSVQFTLFCIGLMMVLVFFGTLDQGKLGAFAAQNVYFNSFFIFSPERFGFRIPVFPGGLTVGFLWIINLLASFVGRFKYARKDAGILITHLGILLLLLGQFFTQTRAEESRLAIEEGETKNYVENTRRLELAFVMTSEKDHDWVTSIPSSYFNHETTIETDPLPFKIKIRKFYPNARLTMSEKNPQTLATRGVGTKISVQELPVTYNDDEINNASALVEIIEGTRSLGTYLTSISLGAPQSFRVDGKKYEIALRPKRKYLPFSLTLKDFTHDVYPGTDIPKNFSSLVHLTHPEQKEDRDALIYMNHPLRYAGLTFYQASFGKNDTLSVLQVVKNPAWLTPYIACALVTLGLAVQFLMHLLIFMKRKR